MSLSRAESERSCLQCWSYRHPRSDLAHRKVLLEDRFFSFCVAQGSEGAGGWLGQRAALQAVQLTPSSQGSRPVCRDTAEEKTPK